MGAPTHADDARPIADPAELAGIFHGAEKPPARFLIGAEAEKFAVVEQTGAPLDYEHGVTRIFAALESSGWLPEREREDGPVIALRRGPESITLEPGSQLELSGAALPDIHEIEQELDRHLSELAPVSKELGLVWLSVGFHPLAAQADLGWVPKQRYGVMREYLPTKGYAAHDMMRRTATVQANFDYENEEDAVRKLVVSLRLSPLIHAMTANAPFEERRRSPFISRRGEVWRHMDPTRSGLIPPFWQKGRLGYRDYIEWALDAGMFLFKRGDRVYYNTGQTFRDFLSNGYEGERATVGDFRLHLNTLFPEARLKNTIEVRACDAQRGELKHAVPALFTGILYDTRALAEAEELAMTFDLDSIEAARPALVTNALRANIAAHPARALAEKLLDIALGGLSRRARLDPAGRDERRHLDALSALVAEGRCPGDETSEGVTLGKTLTVPELIERTRL
jgi:glutamate--cysteine ligase